MKIAKNLEVFERESFGLFSQANNRKAGNSKIGKINSQVF